MFYIFKCYRVSDIWTRIKIWVSSLCEMHVIYFLLLFVHIPLEVWMNGSWNLKWGRCTAQAKPAISSGYCFCLYCFSPIAEIGNGCMKCMGMTDLCSDTEQWDGWNLANVISNGCCVLFLKLSQWKKCMIHCGIPSVNLSVSGVFPRTSLKVFFFNDKGLFLIIKL